MIGSKTVGCKGGNKRCLRVERKGCARVEGKGCERVEGEICARGNMCKGKYVEGWEGNGGGKMCNGGKGETNLGWNAEIWCELN